VSALLALPLLPLAGFLLNGLLGRRLPASVVATVGCALPAAAFALTVALTAELLGGTRPLTASPYAWAIAEGLRIDLSLYFDAVTAVMCLVITGIGTLIHVYSIGYMRGDPGFSRYFAYLNLFLFFMLVLVLGGNLVVLFVGWEGVGLASYLLIGFWFEDPAKTAAGLKAFVVNRAGDAAFLMATFVTWHCAGTLEFQAVNAWFAATPDAAGVATAVGVLLLLGACGKSAQIPLHVWLPDAMAGPTPVSALIHAATMVTAGVYLLARLHGVYEASPDAQLVVTWVGALTAFAGATLATTQTNLKKVLAYSTMSQLGLMVMVCGLGGWAAALFHLYTHAFFKACLFLAAGAVLHALHGEEDMRRMGGLAARLPLAYAAFLLGTLALCGLPPFAGFFSKDEILWLAYAAPAGSPLLWTVGTATSLLTAFYMFRAVHLTFWGPSRSTAGVPAHGTPPSMGFPLVALGAGALLAGFVGVPHAWHSVLPVAPVFFELVEPVVGAARLSPSVAENGATAFAGIAVLAALAGIGLAWWRHGRGRGVPALDDAGGSPIRRALAAGYFVDAFYDRALVRGADALGTALGRSAEVVLSGTGLDGLARAGRRAAAACARLQSGSLQAYLLYALVGLGAVLLWRATGG
jgi:NADH-quinone oxidoreductase subunit L